MVTKGIKIAFAVMIVGLVFAAIYPRVPLLKEGIHYILDPSAGALLNFNATVGMIIITALISLILTLVQRFATDQDSLRQLRKEQKILQEEMKKFKDNPQKLLELQKKQLEFFPKTLDLTMTPLIYTTIPILLFFRWFYDYFAANPTQNSIFGFMSWFWAYLILSIIFSMVYRKLFDMP